MAICLKVVSPTGAGGLGHPVGVPIGYRQTELVLIGVVAIGGEGTFHHGPSRICAVASLFARFDRDRVDGKLGLVCLNGHFLDLSTSLG